MDSTTSATIDKINAQIANLEEQIASAKKTINGLCVMEGEPPLYPDVEARRSSAGAAFRGDQFFGKPVATAVKEILEQRGARNLGAISLNELFEVMKSGGFEFDNNNDPIAKRNLAITLAKNPAFTKVPSNGFIGLSQWYPNVKKKKDAKNNGTEPDEVLSAKPSKRKEA